MSRLTQILRGKKIKPLTEMESAVKYAIDNAGSGGGSSLPAVTSADNGDLLGVVEGAWGKVDPPVDTFTVTLTKESDTWTADKTIAEILTAHEAGKNCVAVGPYGEDEMGLSFSAPLALASSTMNVVQFVGLPDSGTIIIVSGANEETDKWEVSPVEPAKLPDVTSSDNGSLLGVADGEWAKVNPPVLMSDFAFTLTLDDQAITPSTQAHFADVAAAHEAGKICRAVVDATAIGGNMTYAYLTEYAANNKVVWNVVIPFNGTPTLMVIDLDSNDTPHMDTYTLQTST